MIRHLTTLVLGGILGSMVLVGNAEACHKNKCNRGCAAPVVCAAPVPAPCVQRVAKSCAPKPKHCFKISLPKFCQKKKCAPPTPVCYAAATPVYYASPQASAQH